jgi:hypothetical protein
MTEPAPLVDLAKRYRTFAIDARLSAATARGDALRDQFLELATQWESLAVEAETVADARES